MSQEPVSEQKQENISSNPSIEVVADIVRKLEAYPAETQRRILQVVRAWLHPNEEASVGSGFGLHGSKSTSTSPKTEDPPFSNRAEALPKEFMLEKDPKTDAERLTCLAYYLTHYRNQPYFKTEDLSKLNTEAAQRKFANAAFTAKNSMRDGFLVAAPKAGLRQLSAFGEQYVQALPDHEAAKNVRKKMKPHASRSRNRGGSGESREVETADQ